MEGEVTHLSGYQVGGLIYELGAKKELVDGDINLKVISVSRIF